MRNASVNLRKKKILKTAANTKGGKGGERNPNAEESRVTSSQIAAAAGDRRWPPTPRSPPLPPEPPHPCQLLRRRKNLPVSPPIRRCRGRVSPPINCATAPKLSSTSRPKLRRRSAKSSWPCRYGNHRIISQPLKKSEAELLIVFVFVL